ncbi:MAG: hypothetical protein COT85_07910 [Chlamydiae bacterium CG10_big_fil_rev_8_21_14_0_10_42_34]|nr:MAG: hypothetical protein COT85_07910 [Chlamydiae bacterium CG10_big_fil_rev_8_21_14_0_10_42_34]
MSISEYYKSCVELNNLFEISLASPEECIQFESQIQDILSRAFKDVKNLKISAEKLRDVTDKPHRKRDYKAGLLNRGTRQVHKELYQWSNKSIDSAIFTFEEIGAQQKFSQQNEVYDRKILEHSVNYHEVLGLFKTIYRADAKGEENNRAQKRLQELKQILEQDFIDLARLSENPDLRISKIDWDLHRNSYLRNCEEVEFYSRSEESNRTELDQLLEQESQEYLPKSILYQSKLISQKKYDAASVYAREWLSSLSPDASWQSVEAMAQLFMAAKLDWKQLDLVDFKTALLSWLKNRPDIYFENDANPLAFVKDEDGSRAMQTVIARLYLQIEDLSFDAHQSYQNCAILMPDQPVWKAMQARFHVSALQYSEAKACLDDLPDEHSSLIRQDIANSQYLMFSFGGDLLSLGISRCVVPFAKNRTLDGGIVSQSLDALNIVIQTATNPVMKNYWIAQYGVDYPESLVESLRQTSFLSAIFTCSNVAADLAIPRILDRFSSNREERDWYRKYREAPLFFVKDIGSVIIQNWGISSSASLVIPTFNLGFSFVNVVCKTDFLLGNKRNPDTRAMMITAQKVAASGAVLNIVYQGRSIIIGCAKNVAFRCNSGRIFSVLSNSLKNLPIVVGNSAQIATGMAIAVGFAILYEFPSARSACIMEEALSLCNIGEHQQARNLLSKAKNWFSFLADIQAINSYESCLDFIALIPHLKEDQSGRDEITNSLNVINTAVEILRRSCYYAGVCDDLLFHKITAYIKTGQYNEARLNLSNESLNSMVRPRILLFVIKESGSLASSDFVLAKSYLDKVEHVFDLVDYKEIIKEYQKYIACLNKSPNMPESKESLRAVQRNQAIDSLLHLCKQKRGLTPLYEDLQYESLQLNINTCAYENAFCLLKQTGPRIHDRLAISLIGQIEQFCAKGEYDEVIQRLENIRDDLNVFNHKNLMVKYLDYVVLRKLNPVITATVQDEIILQRERGIDDIVCAVLNSDIHPVISISMQLEKLCLYLDAHRYGKAIGLLSQAGLAPEIKEQAALYMIQKANRLFVHQKDSQALAYLLEAYNALDGFVYREFLNYFAGYLACDREKFVSEVKQENWITSADTLLAAIAPVKGMSSLYTEIQCQKFLLYAREQKYQMAKNLLGLMDISPEIRHQLENYLIGFLIHRVDIEVVYGRLQHIVEEFGVSENKLLQCYVEVLNQLRHNPAHLQNLNEAVQSMDRLTQILAEVRFPPPLWIDVQKTRYYIQIGISHAEAGDQREALKAYSSAELILRKDMKEENLKILNQIDVLKRRIFCK